MRKTISLLALLLAGSVQTAIADPPSVETSTIPPGFTLVGGRSGSPDSLAAATFVIRDLSNYPVPSADVVLDFSGCPDLRLSPDMADPGIVVDCANKTVRGVTDANGRITFRIVGSGAGGPPRAVPACIQITAQDRPMPSRIVSAFDLDGLNGVTLIDVAIAYAYVIAGSYNPRADYDYNGYLSLVDLTLLLRACYNGGSLVSGAPCTP